jgi:hypothetical protein
LLIIARRYQKKISKKLNKSLDTFLKIYTLFGNGRFLILFFSSFFMKEYVQKLQKFFKKLWKRFSNYNNSKKWFVLYLIILTLFLLLPPLVKINAMRGVEGSSYGLLFSSGYFRSLVVVLISLVFLLGWNLSVKFKGFVINLFSLREDEPLVDFAFLWVITSVFM